MGEQFQKQLDQPEKQRRALLDELERYQMCHL
jgi:hypothetical protein